MPKFTREKQPKLPALRQAEVLASLVYVVLYDSKRLSEFDKERFDAHLRNLEEYGLLEGSLSADDVLPF